MSVVMVGGLDDYLIKVAEGLVTRGVPVTHFLDRYQRPASRRGVLANVASIDAKQFTAPETILQLNKGKKPILTAELLEQFAKAELVWLAVIDRYTHVMSVTDRRRLFRDLLEYFYRWLSEEKITAIIFPNVPHAGWNNVLYFVAKHFHIPTYILEATRLNDRVMVWEDYESVEKVPADFLAGASIEVVKHHVDPVLLAELATDSSWMVVSDEINKDALRWSGTVGEIITLIRALAMGLVKRQRPRDLLFDKPWSWWNAHFRRYLLRRQARQRRVVYEGLAKKTVPKEPYVLFFLNYQPEKTTTPMGGVFDDQLLAVRLLAHSLPTGWRLLVKEHPRQFGAHVDAAPYRSVAYYKELVSLPNVQLVSPNASTAELLTKCVATATITGSIGWQGLLAGKPAINFGRSWYAACRGCYVVSSAAEVAAAMADLQHKDAAAIELDIYKFLAFARSELIIGGNGDPYIARSQRSLEVLADSLAEAILHKLNHVLTPGVHPVYTPGVEAVR